MNMLRLLVWLLLLTAVGHAQRLDTLKYYGEGSGYVYYRDPAITMQAARFELAAPARVHAVTLTLGGLSADGSVRLRVFGHEGGLPAPGIERDLMRPLIVKKTRAGVERRTIEFKTPVHISSHQLYIAVDQISPGVLLLSDRIAKRPPCITGDDQFTFQALRDRNNRWQWGEYAYAVEAMIEYDKPTASGQTMRDVTGLMYLEDSTNSGKSIAWADIDRDSYIDLLVGGRLYRNESGARFRDITQSSGLSGVARAGVFVDVDSDGLQDLLLIGEIAETDTVNVLYRCEPDRTFTRHLLAIPKLENPTSISIADANDDGYPDLFIGQGPARNGGLLPNYLLLNNGRYDFVDGTALLRGIEGRTSACRGSQWVDVDSDGDLDLFMAGDGVHGNQIWLREPSGIFNSAPHGQFILDDPDAMRAGCHWFDYDNDGRIDLLLPARHTAAAARTKASLRGSLVRRATGTGYEVPDDDRIPYEEQRAGGSWGDVDNDGLADIILTTACDCRYAGIFSQEQGGRFADRTYEWGLARVAAGNDAMWIDYDNDGRLDLATFVAGRISLWRNELPEVNKYVELDLRGPHAAGAEVKVWAEGRQYNRQAASGRGILMQEPARLHFGLGLSRTIDSAIVRWGNGESETFRDLAVNTVHIIDGGKTSTAFGGTVSDISAAPNPFSSKVAIDYSLSSSQHVHLGIYTLDGASIRTLIDDRQEAGSHSLVWEGDDSNGDKVAQGTYIYRLMVGGWETSGPLVLVR